MTKKILFAAIAVILAFAVCTETKDVTAIGQKEIEQVAKIAAAFETDAVTAMNMLEAENMTADKYKEIIAKIALDEKATSIFVELKEKYMTQAVE